jgi:hypothetical protein
MPHRLATAAFILVTAVVGAWRAVVNSCRAIIADLAATYHPEAHYMRGPGPKWREKHAGAETGH